jgi:hypothetical protein
VLAAFHFIPTQANGFGKRKPGFDAPLVLFVTVVIKNALNPQAPGIPIAAIREDRRIFERDGLLVVEAVGNPTTHGFGRNAVVVHRLMEGMMDVVEPLLAA